MPLHVSALIGRCLGFWRTPATFKNGDLQLLEAKLHTIADSLKQLDVQLAIRTNPRLHDREINLSNGWSIKIGRGFDIYQRPDDWLHIGSNDLDLRPCLETSVEFGRNREDELARDERRFTICRSQLCLFPCSEEFLSRNSGLRKRRS